MPEVLAVVAVFVVTLIAWIGAWLHARDPANQNVHDDIQRLRQHAAWLDRRIEVAQRERWGGDMIVSLEEERQTTMRALARASGTIDSA